MLLIRNADVHVTNVQGDTALHALFHASSLPEAYVMTIARSLMKAGLQPSKQNCSGRTPLELALASRQRVGGGGWLGVGSGGCGELVGGGRVDCNRGCS